jgi:hypothetical protein
LEVDLEAESFGFELAGLGISVFGETGSVAGGGEGAMVAAVKNTPLRKSDINFGDIKQAPAG